METQGRHTEVVAAGGRAQDAAAEVGEAVDQAAEKAVCAPNLRGARVRDIRLAQSCLSVAVSLVGQAADGIVG